MLEWSAAVAAGAWVVLSLVLIIGVFRCIRLIRKAEQSIQSLQQESVQLVQQLQDFTRRSDEVLKRAEEAAAEVAEWRETTTRVRDIIEEWNSRIVRWSRRTEDAVDSAHRANEHRIQETLQWLDMTLAIWKDIQKRRSRYATESTEEPSQGK